MSLAEIPTLTERLATEVAQLQTLTALHLLGRFALLLVAVWLLGVLAPMGIRIAWRLGLDGARRLAPVSSLVRVLALLLAIGGTLEPFWDEAPMLSTIGAFLVAGLLAALAPSSLRNVAAGMILVFRARLRPGDLVRIGEVEGTIRDVGLTRVSLRPAEGGVTFVPTADFERLPLTIGSRQAAIPVEVSLQPERPLDDVMLERLRHALWLSPFRRAGTEVRVFRDGETGRIDARIDTWAPRTTAELEPHLRELMRRVTTPPSEPEPGGEEEEAT